MSWTYGSRSTLAGTDTVGFCRPWWLPPVANGLLGADATPLLTHSRPDKFNSLSDQVINLGFCLMLQRSCDR